MAGLFSNDEHPSFSWGAKEEIFDNLGIPQKREDYLQDLSGTGNNEREVKEQLRSLDESEMKQILYQLPEEDKDEFVQTYFGLME